MPDLPPADENSKTVWDSVLADDSPEMQAARTELSGNPITLDEGLQNIAGETGLYISTQTLPRGFTGVLVRIIGGDTTIRENFQQVKLWVEYKGYEYWQEWDMSVESKPGSRLYAFHKRSEDDK